MSVKSVLSSTAVFVLGALALTACQPGSTASVSGSASDGSAPKTSVSAAPSGTSAPAPASSASAPSASTTAGGTGSSGSGSSGKSSGSGDSAGKSSGTARSGGNANSDSYAYTHPCSSRQLSVHVVRRDAAAGQRVIEVRNVGANSCGLSYYPRVYLDDSHAADGSQAVRPLIPSGLGGAPAYPVYAGRTAYAVIDLDPSGATTGTVKGVDELNVLADGDHMPNADTLNFPLGSGALVLKPKLGLYRDNVADAVASMRQADTQS